MTEDGWPLQDVGEAGLCRVGQVLVKSQLGSG